MERGLYIAASGMVSEMARQDLISNDLANASTAGYKSDTAVQGSFGELLLQNTQTGATVGALGQGSRIERISGRIADSLIGTNVRIHPGQERPRVHRFLIGDNSEIGIL